MDIPIINNDGRIIEDIISLLMEAIPDADERMLRESADRPLDAIYPINSHIGMYVATELRDKYGLSEVPRMKGCNRENYISLNGILGLIKEWIEQQGAYEWKRETQTSVTG